MKRDDIMKKPACLQRLTRHADDITTFAAVAFLLFILVRGMLA